MELNNMGKLLELIDLYRYGTITGERTELIVAPLFKDGKYDDSKRVITIGIQGGISRDRDTFVVDAKNFDSKVFPYLMSYYEGSDDLVLETIERSTRDNITSKSIYETEAGDLMYLETLNNSLFDVVDSKKNDINKTIVKPSKTQEEKDWEEILLYGRKSKEKQDLYDKILSPYDVLSVDKMIETLATRPETNFGKSRKVQENNQKIIEEFVKDSDFSEDLKEVLLNQSWKLASFLGAEKRIRTKLDQNDVELQEKIHFAARELTQTDYYDSRYLRNRSSSSVNSKQSEIKKIVDWVSSKEHEDKGRIEKLTTDLLKYLDTNSEKNSIRRTINEVLNTEIEEIKDVSKDNYNELEETIDLVIGGKLDTENFEFIVNKENDGTRHVRISITNGLSRTDDFEFIFTNGDEFDSRLKVILANLNKIENTKVFGNQDEAEIDLNKNNILLRGYSKDFYELPKVLTKNVRKEINTTSFAQLHEYVNKYKIKNNNDLEVFERDSLLPYDPVSEREKLDIEFAIYWNVMAGIFESAYDTMLGEKYAFNSINEKLFNIMNDYFASTTLADEEVDLLKLKRLFADSKVPHAMVIFNRLFKNQYYLDYVKKYYSSIVEMKEYELEETNVKNESEFDISKLSTLEQQIIAAASQMSLDEDHEYSEELTSEDIKLGAEEQAIKLKDKDDADLQAQEIITKTGAEEQAKDIKNKEDAEAQAQEIVGKIGAKEQAEDIFRKEVNAGAKDQADEIFTKDLIVSGSDEQAKKLLDAASKDKTSKELMEAAEQEAKFVLDRAVLERLERDILESAKLQYELENAAIDQALELNERNNRIDLIKQIRDSLNEIIKVKKAEESLPKSEDLDKSSHKIYDQYDEYKDLILAVDDATTFADVNNPLAFKIHFVSPEEAEINISLGNVEKEESLFQKRYSKDKILFIASYLVEEYVNNNEVTFNKTFELPNTNKGSIILLGTHDNVFQVTNTPINYVELIKMKVGEVLSSKNVSEAKTK